MLVEQLRSKMSATERLVTSFVRLGGKKESLLLQDEAYKHCQIAQTEASVADPSLICTDQSPVLVVAIGGLTT